MHERKHYSPAAASYARAALELAEEQKLSPENIGAEFGTLRDLVESDAAFKMYLADPTISAESRWESLKQVLSGRVSTVVLQTIGVMNEKGRLSLLGEVADAYANLLDAKLGKVEVDLIVASKLTAEQLEEARKRISQALKRDAVLHPYVDESIIGGVVVRVGDQLIDASVKNQLHSIKEKLLAARPH